MTYSTTMTSKGQVTIPKAVRDALQLGKSSKFIVSIQPKSRSVILVPHPDILELAGKFKGKMKGDVLKAREAMETDYERV